MAIPFKLEFGSIMLLCVKVIDTIYLPDAVMLGDGDGASAVGLQGQVICCTT